MNWLLLKPCGQSLALTNPCSGACGIGGNNGVVRAYAHAPCNPPTATHPQISRVPCAIRRRTSALTLPTQRH